MNGLVMDYTKTIAARLSIEQYQKLLDFIGDEKASDYIRRLIAEDFARHGEPYPDYEFVDNEMRSRLNIRGRGDA
jgi:hypothetical protein